VRLAAFAASAKTNEAARVARSGMALLEQTTREVEATTARQVLA
jgi:hypothetical protein